LPKKSFNIPVNIANTKIMEAPAVYSHKSIDESRFNDNALFDTPDYISRLKIESYCREHNIPESQKERLILKVDEHNESYINIKLSEHKEYFDSILKAVDPAVKLDDEQRRAIVTEEEYCLLIAGAGAGKTTTMAAKVKYLVDVKGVSPEEIVVISYTTKAIGELVERINKKLGIPVKISTFHSFGYDILKRTREQAPVVNYSSYNIIFDCIKNKVFDNQRLMSNLVLFLGYYFDLPAELKDFSSLKEYSTYKADLDYESLKSRLGDYIESTADKRSKTNRTIEGEFLRSSQEVQIANFLYLHKIDYEYEKPYPKEIAGAKKLYTPDFFIRQGGTECYIEHYGIAENFQSLLYSASDLEKYRKHITDKRRIHRDNSTSLIETWGQYNDERSLLEHLCERLSENGFTLEKRSDEEVYRKIVDTEQDKFVWKLIQFIIRFIDSFKTCGYNESGFAVLRKKSDNVRIRLFLDIAEDVYTYYQNELKKQNKIDFADMINDAERILKEISSSADRPRYKYIIIDEFQDIAKQRFNLTKTLADATGARVVAVGDDWQSIFAFAGSNISLFHKFLEIMGSGKELFINHTYRNAQQLIDIAGGFIQKNSSQIKKRLISPKSLEYPIVVECYNDSEYPRKRWIQKIEDTIGKIVSEFGEKSKVLMIGRYNFDRKFIVSSDLFSEKTETKIVCRKYPKVDIDFLTVHTAKGLGYDNVVLVNMVESMYGFPCQIEDDPIMKLVTYVDSSIGYAEERRLFYVALTRTKNKVFLIAPASKPSRFLLELVNDYSLPHDSHMSMIVAEKQNLKCPICKFPLKYVNNQNFGLPLYMCTNEPEICDFMSNDKVALSDIYKCPKCSDGYMIVKKNKNTGQRFYGCTNYNSKSEKCTNNAMIYRTK
jgi:DNA helicase-4